MLDLEYLDPYLNLSVEEAIFRAVDAGRAPNTLRFWRNRNAVVVGYAQDVPSEVNLDACFKYDIVIARRFTGGGAVYQDHGNLNWTVVVRKNHIIVPKNIFEFYNIIGKVITASLVPLGIKAVVRDNGIYVRDRKITGMAMRIGKAALLCHGTLLVSTDLAILYEALNACRKKSSSACVEVTTIEREIKRNIPISDIKNSIISAFESLFGIKLKYGKLTVEEKELSRMLYAEKYSRNGSLTQRGGKINGIFNIK